MLETTFVNIALKVGIGIWVGVICLLVLYAIYGKYRRTKSQETEVNKE